MAIVPHPTPEDREFAAARRVDARLGSLVRAALVLIALGLAAIFAIAFRLNPYRDGKLWLEGTHQQLGLKPCTFRSFTGYPCPSCGMSTSFALLVRGDVWHSLQANAVGTLLAVFCVLAIPWTVASAIRGRVLFLADPAMVFVRLLVCFFALLLLRWGVVLLGQVM